jgi:hypothetical protein
MNGDEINRVLSEAAFARKIRLPYPRSREQTIEIARTAKDAQGNLIVPRELFTETESSFRSVVKRIEYPQGSFDQHAIAVTSLSPSESSFERQSKALESWVKFGLTIVSVNQASEISKLKRLYPQVDQWIRCKERVPLIRTLATVAVKLDRTILLINSDIEVYGQHERLAEHLADPMSQTVGIRFNYANGDYESAVIEPHGLDVFSFTPAMARSLPGSPLCIGKPVWDYWVPCHFRSLGYKFNFIGDPMFFHSKHDIQWSGEDWMTGARWLEANYPNEFSVASCVEFRRTFPYPPPLPP